MSFNRTSFQQQLKHLSNLDGSPPVALQSYILSTTTETIKRQKTRLSFFGFNRTSFQQQLKPDARELLGNAPKLQSYILSTTTETRFDVLREILWEYGFNRTSFQQQLKPRVTTVKPALTPSFNRTSFQQQLKQYLHNQLPTVLWYNSHIDLLL